MSLQKSLRAYLPKSRRAKRQSSLLGVAALALAGSAVLVGRRAAKAERDYPAKGRFITVDGVRLHYMERGSGQPVVFMHGNGAMIDDMLISGVFDQAAEHYRAIVFDRPGFGHSARPRDRSWTAAAQAALFAKTLHELGITRPIVVGHSWGTLVALSLALAHPQLLSGLVLASGYYFPTARADVALLSPPSLPIVGDLLTHTIAPLIGEALGPGMIKKMFAPQPVSQRFAREFPMALTLRPSQVKAFSEDTSHMINAAGKICGSYAALRCPTVIMAGDADGIVDVDRQARRLHGAVPGSRIDILRGAGHMVHHLDPGRMIRAIDLIASGGITRESVEAEAATWGIPA